MPRFRADHGGFTGGIQTGYDSYFDMRCTDDDDENETNDEDDYDRPGYDRYDDEPSEEEEENKYKSRRRVKTRVTRKLSLRFSTSIYDIRIERSLQIQI